ncbi:family 16 glycoside hydrolase [Actinoallomurus sp. CA-142502]|uniref:family 16 glycoside hydrolase n=1 Tax=Actinoallomurus sp. CA-142502 TaxID=3239885 RepID=UPI003D8B8FDB
MLLSARRTIASLLSLCHSLRSHRLCHRCKSLRIDRRTPPIRSAEPTVESCRWPGTVGLSKPRFPHIRRIEKWSLAVRQHFWMKSMIRRAVCLLGAVVAAVAVLALPGTPALGNVSGNALYSPSSSNETLAYNRMIRLQHSGRANGRLLASFERSGLGGAPSRYVIRQSTNDGQTWSTLATVSDGETGEGHPWNTLFQPFLFEFPRATGGLPAGTLLLVGNVLPPGRSTTHFEEWRSTDHGATWHYVETFQIGGASAKFEPGGVGAGIWEPFLIMNSRGEIECYFSDERQNKEHSQKLVHIVSADGGRTWSANADGSTRVSPGEVEDVASPTRSDRPGMVTIAVLPNVDWIMSFELCGTNHFCEAHVKTSKDEGRTWGSGPADLGTEVVTDDGRYLGSSPFITWSPAGGANGELLLTGMRTRFASGNGFSPEDHQAVFVNSDNGTGTWSWMPAPINVGGAGPTANCYQNYSPDLLPSSSGRMLRYTAARASGTYGCEESTGEANAGVLPYASDFGAGDAGWLSYGGCWTTASDTYVETCGGDGGNKALAGSTGWTNYTISGDVMITSGTQAGFVFRATDPRVGADAFNGYYVGVSSTRLILGRENGSWTLLSQAAIPGGLAHDRWYHLTIRAVGCRFTITGSDGGETAPIAFSHTDAGCFTHGAIGVRDQSGTAAWRNITVTHPGR